MRKTVHSTMAMAMAMAILLGVSIQVQAATFAVTKTADTADGTCDADCSLREAIIAANANVGFDAIHLPADVYVLDLVGAGEDAAATGDLDVLDGVTISGVSAIDTIIDGNATDGVFHIDTAGTVRISRVTIRNGNKIGDGGGILLSGGATVLIDLCAIVDNVSDSQGGGILVFPATLTISDSTVSGNTAFFGGGILAFFNLLTVKNTTVSGNVATDDVGGIAGFDATLNNVTVTDNFGGTDFFDCGGVCSDAAVTNSIIANNEPFDCVLGAGLGLGSSSHTLDTDGSCNLVGTGDLPFTASPGLDILANNGGSTETISLLTGSPAIDAGDDATCTSRDQRRYNRSGTCDMGAFELGGFPYCSTTAVLVCVDASAAKLDYNENTAGKEKMKMKWKKLLDTTQPGDFGDPVAGTTAVALCIYNDANDLVQEFVVDRAGEQCASKDCWKAKGTSGYGYKDKDNSADGVSKLLLKAGNAKAKTDAKGKNNWAKGQTSLPIGVIAGLRGNMAPTIQMVTSDGLCVSATMNAVKKDEATRYAAQLK